MIKSAMASVLRSVAEQFPLVRFQRSVPAALPGFMISAGDVLPENNQFRVRHFKDTADCLDG